VDEKTELSPRPPSTSPTPLPAPALTPAPALDCDALAWYLATSFLACTSCDGCNGRECRTNAEGSGSVEVPAVTTEPWVRWWVWAWGRPAAAIACSLTCCHCAGEGRRQGVSTHKAAARCTVWSGRRTERHLRCDELCLDAQVEHDGVGLDMHGHEPFLADTLAFPAVAQVFLERLTGHKERRK